MERNHQQQVAGFYPQNDNLVEITFASSYFSFTGRNQRYAISDVVDFDYLLLASDDSTLESQMAQLLCRVLYD